MIYHDCHHYHIGCSNKINHPLPNQSPQSPQLSPLSQEAWEDLAKLNKVFVLMVKMTLLVKYWWDEFCFRAWASIPSKPSPLNWLNMMIIVCRSYHSNLPYTSLPTLLMFSMLIIIKIQTLFWKKLISSSRAVNPPMRPCGVVVLLKPSVTPNNLYIDNLHFWFCFLNFEVNNIIQVLTPL